MTEDMTDDWKASLTQWSQGPQPCLTQWNYEPCFGGYPRWMGHGGKFWQNVVHWRKDWKPLQYPCLENLINSVTQSCLTLWDPMNHSMPGLPVHHQLPEFTQTYVHWVSDAIQPSHPRSSPSPPAPNPSQHQTLFQWVNSLHEVAKVLEFQLKL